MLEIIKFALSALHFSNNGYVENQMIHDHKSEVIQVNKEEPIAYHMHPATR